MLYSGNAQARIRNISPMEAENAKLTSACKESTPRCVLLASAMEKAEKTERRVLPASARSVACDAHNYFAREKINNEPLTNVTRVYDRSCEATNVPRRIMERIIKEGRDTEEEFGEPTFSGSKVRCNPF